MLKVITLFTGIGAQEAALKRLNIPFEVVGISEIDKYAIQSYEAINGPTFNYGDITKIPMLDYADLWTYSFPCQDLSVAGKQAGISEGTRSGLLLHVERLLETAVLLGNQPKYLLLENVKALVSKKFKPDFDKWLQKLESLGYNNYWQVLNAKDYGVPQNRERVFVVSIRKDVDTKGYKFPEKIPLTRKLKDVLEPVVDEKYYLSQDKVDKLVMNMNVTDNTGAILSKYGTHLNKTTDVAGTLMARDYKGFGNQETNGVIEPQVNCLGNIYGLDSHGGFGGDVFDENGISRTIMADGGNRTPYICASRGRNPDNPSDRTAGAPTEQRIEVNTTGCSNTLTSVQKDNYLLESAGLYIHDSEAFHRKPLEGLSRCLKAKNHDAAVVQLGNIVDTGNWDNPQRDRIYSPNGCSPALNTMQGGGLEPKIVIGSTQKNAYVGDVNNYSPCLTEAMGMGGGQIPMLANSYRIRKLTPLECWRLMDFTDEEFYAAQLSGVSNSQLYKQAGNSIVVAVLQAIFKELLA